MVKGKTLEEAEKVNNQDIADYLGGLPEQKMHCSVMGREALELAIHNYRTGDTSRKILEGKVVCHCFGVTEEEIERVVRDNRLTTIEQVANYCKAGGACGKCHNDISAIIARITGETPPPVQKEKPRRLTTLQKIKLIEETLEKEVRPALRKDGGDIELLDVVGGRVIVALRGMCANCQVARFTLKDVVEAKLKEFVAPDITVEEEPSK
jgi:NifU-like protein